MSQLRTAGVLRVLFGSALFGFCGSLLGCALSRSRGSFLGSVLLGSRGPPFRLRVVRGRAGHFWAPHCSGFADHPSAPRCSGLTGRPPGLSPRKPSGVALNLLPSGRQMWGFVPHSLGRGPEPIGHAPGGGECVWSLAAEVRVPDPGGAQIQLVRGTGRPGQPSSDPVSLPRTEWRWARRGLQQAAGRLDRPPRSRWQPWR